MELTTKEKKILTEWLGDTPSATRFKVVLARFNAQTSKSGFQTRESAQEYADKSNRKHSNLGAEVQPYIYGKDLDFFDWRVVGRLVEKLGFYRTYWLVESYGFQREADKVPQLAICRAILAFLQEGEK